jgi:hypothetical protein
MKYLKSRKKFLNKIKKEELVIRRNPELFKQYTGIGFKRDQAIHYVKTKVPDDLEILTTQYNRLKDKPWVSGIVMEGIKRNEKVEKWIDDMETKGLLKDEGCVLRFSKEVI